MSLTTILLPALRGRIFSLPILLPAESDVGFLRVSGHFLQAHNLKVVGSNPTPATTKTLHSRKIEMRLSAVALYCNITLHIFVFYSPPSLLARKDFFMLFTILFHIAVTYRPALFF